MDDLDKLFRRLVQVLRADESYESGTPFQVSELYQTLLPYRTFRRELGFDSIGDYEMAVLRLLAGERGYATVEPAEARQALAKEAKSANPDTAAFRQYAAARVVLDDEAVRDILDEAQAYAPPSPPPSTTEPEPPPPLPTPEPPAEPTASSVQQPVFEAVDIPREPAREGGTNTTGGTRATCPDCGGALPSHRRAVFCPFCARQLAATKCRECGDQVEPGWQYCITCGRPVSGT